MKHSNLKISSHISTRDCVMQIWDRIRLVPDSCAD